MHPVFHDGEQTGMFQIRAERNFWATTVNPITKQLEQVEIVKGMWGGILEEQRQLSHEGNCWIFPRGCVHGSRSKITGNSTIANTVVFESATQLLGNVYVSGGESGIYTSCCVIKNMLPDTALKIVGNLNFSDVILEDCTGLITGTCQFSSFKAHHAELAMNLTQTREEENREMDQFMETMTKYAQDRLVVSGQPEIIEIHYDGDGNRTLHPKK